MPLKDIKYSPETSPALTAEPDIDRLYPQVGDSVRILAACLPSEYAASIVARAVEDADARLLNINITSDGEEMDNRVVFELRVNHRSPRAVCHSLERYGFEVLDVESASIEADPVMSERVAELLRHINI